MKNILTDQLMYMFEFLTFKGLYIILQFSLTLIRGSNVLITVINIIASYYDYNLYHLS